ncbi:hypothetical protein JXA47_17090 [Candidatus Sumerlaeota bacterium]|nr:hypothetical protein [Candidatus Sumerlaeota bacterium]
MRLRDNPLLQQLLRGGCHASWRRWYRTPWLQVSVITLMLLLFNLILAIAEQTSDDWPQFLSAMGFLILALTAWVSTLAVIAVISGGVGKLWRQGRVFDLLLSPMTGREIVTALLLGLLAAWGVWALIVAIYCMGSYVLNPHVVDFAHDFEMIMGGTDAGRMINFLRPLGYTLGQTVWAAAVTMSVATRRRSVSAIQYEAALWLILVTPLLIGGLEWVGVEFAAQAGYLMIEIVGPTIWHTLLVWTPRLFAVGVWVVKIGLSVWLLRGAARHFHTRMVKQLERSVRAEV